MGKTLFSPSSFLGQAKFQAPPVSPPLAKPAQHPQARSQGTLHNPAAHQTVPLIFCARMRRLAAAHDIARALHINQLKYNELN